MVRLLVNVVKRKGDRIMIRVLPQSCIKQALVILTLSVLVSSTAFSQSIDPDTYEIIPIDGLNLNRTASKRTASQITSYNLDPAYKAFIWNSGDNATSEWRPQGIAGVDAGSSQFLVVSWYHYNQGGNGYKGARLSFVNITDWANINYRHVLLVDDSYNPFPGLHAGGLFIVGDSLFVPDSRAGKDSIYVFNLNFIKLVPEVDRSHFYDYVYILARTGGESVPITPSFISYDYDQQKMLVGKFQECEDLAHGDPYCGAEDSLNKAGWYDLGNYNGSSPYYSGFIGKMQGMASKLDPMDPNRTIVWIATSYKVVSSHLFVFSHEFEEDTVQAQIANMGNDFFGYTLKAGMEDLYLEENGQDLWSLTEFGMNIYDEFRNRIVFCFDVADVPPPNHRYTQDNLVDSTISENTELEYVAATNYVAHADFNDDYSHWIRCSTVVPSLVNSDRSVFAWILKANPVSGSQMIVGMNDRYGGNLCNLEVTDNKLAVFDGTTLHSTGITVTDYQWHFVGYTYDNSTNLTLVYVDGVISAAFVDDQHITDNLDRISIGQEFDGQDASNFYNGYITEVSFWNSVLDSADISSIMSRTINNTHPKYNSLQAYYPMLVVEGDDNFIVKDFSGHGYDGSASMRTIQQQKHLVEIPEYNSIDHFDVSWMKNQSVISTSDTLRFVADGASLGTYQLKLSVSDFTITDSFDLTVTTEVEDDNNQLPAVFQLCQNYPNPFNPVTTIDYSLPRRSQVTIEIFNVLGQKVRTLLNREESAGSYQIEWPGIDDAGRPVSTGVYLYRFQAGDVVQTKKMMLLK
jgi:hypothetical protein